MSSDTEIVVQLTAETAQLQAGMEQGAATVQDATDKMASSFETQKTDLALLYDALVGNTKSTEALAQQQAALSRIQEAGSQPAQTLTDATTALSAAAVRLAVTQDAVAESTADATVELEAATAATVENTAAQINSRTAYSASALITDALTGQFSRSRREVAALANETGIMSSAFSFLLSPLGLATAAVVAFGVAAVEAQRDSVALEASIINTGGAYGYNADQLKQMANAIAATGATSRQAKEAVDDVAGSGVIMGDNFRNAAQAAADMAQTMGLSVDKAVEEIEKLQENPVKAIETLNQTMNILTPTEAAQIVHLQDIGDKAGAAAKAIELLRNAEDARASKISAAGGGNSGLLGGFESMVSNGASGIMAAFQSGTLKDSISSVNNELLKYNEISQNAVTISASGVTLDKSKIATSDYANLVALVEKRTALEAQITAQQEKQQQVETQTDADKAKVNATLSAHKSKSTGGSGDSGLAADDRQLFQEMQLNRTMSLAAEKAYWQSKLQDAQQGSAEYRQALTQLVDIKNKELSQDKQEGNKQATAAREAARKEVEEAREASQERISMEREVTREMQKAAAQNIQAQQDVEKSTITAAQGAFAAQKQAIESAFDLHQTTKQQELAQLAAANDAEYALELSAMQKYLALLDTKSKAYATTNLQIEKLEQTHQQAMQKIQEQTALANQQMWEKRLQPINQAFDQSINGMIQGTQTFKQGIDKMLVSVVESYAESIVKTTTQWLAGELAKTSATVAGNEARTVSNAAASRQGMADEVLTQEKQIFNAAKVAAANAFSSVAAIPVIGPELAPFAAAGAFVAVEAFGNLSSAEGGWERVPANVGLTQLHPNEMVLPAKTADHVRDSMGKGGGGGNHYHFSAMDTRGLKDAFRRNPAAFAAGAKHAARMGHR